MFSFNIEIILYGLFTVLSALAISGINFDGFIKKGKIIEARLLVMLLSISLGYLVTNFVLIFINL